tara:strand:+ start:293 stop:1441 length:1149 start_codon:yes stop_codon:yes gene_type:complete
LAKRKPKNIYLVTEPDWKKLALITDPEKQSDAFSSCEYFCRTEVAKKVRVRYAKDWIKNKSDWDEEEINIILKCPDWEFTSGSHFFIESKLGYMPGSIRGYIEKRKPKLLKHGKQVAEERALKAKEKPKKVISIQERMQAQVESLCGQWEYYIDELVDEDFDIKKFDPYKEMLIYQPEIKGPHAKIIKDIFEPQYNEAIDILKWKDPDIKEAYGHFSLKMRKSFVAFFEKINTACDTVIQTKAVKRRARKPKARSKETIVKKLKYQKDCGQLGLVSVPPTDIINANEVWVYNTKTRKVGVYHAIIKDPRNMGRGGLTVKGTTIKEFCKKSSLQRTLRKPGEQIKNWTGNAKTKFAKAFEEVKTIETKLNGRVNDCTIILKAF